MKLEDLLARELLEWPDDVLCIYQSQSGWARCVELGAVCSLDRLASDYDSAQVTRAQWEAARAKHLGEHAPNPTPADELTQLCERVAELEELLRRECQHSADQKLRADQMTEQHAMQSKMHADAAGKLAAISQMHP